jgi:crotonobetainyl-CoA:carnitine CoA-transferase CaiB-like acyl-CoA transferase
MIGTGRPGAGSRPPEPGRRWRRRVASPAGLSDTPGLNRGPSPLLGQHTTEVLAELGYDEGRIAELVGSVCIQHEEKPAE